MERHYGDMTDKDEIPNLPLGKWGTIQRHEGEPWASALGMNGVMVDELKVMRLNIFMESPSVSHLEICLIGSAGWVACFDRKIIERAWRLGVFTQLIPVTDRLHKFALGAWRIYQGQEMIDPEHSIVRYPTEESLG